MIRTVPALRVTSESRGYLRDIAKRGRIASLSNAAQEQRSHTQKAHYLARTAWDAKETAGAIDLNTFKSEIQPRLSNFSIRKIASALGVSDGSGLVIAVPMGQTRDQIGRASCSER